MKPHLQTPSSPRTISQEKEDTQIKHPLVDEVVSMTKEFIKHLGLSAQVYCRDRRHEDVPHVWIEIMTEESGLLIGERGTNLRALEHLLRLQLRSVLPEKCRCLVDVNTYRLRRIEFLKKLARDSYQKVSRTRHAITLEPMSAMERRVIHLTLADLTDVETESIGNEPQRRIIIRPRDPLAS